jgi:hypothetical protein
MPRYKLSPNDPADMTPTPPPTNGDAGRRERRILVIRRSEGKADFGGCGERVSRS